MALGAALIVPAPIVQTMNMDGPGLHAVVMIGLEHTPLLDPRVEKQTIPDLLTVGA